GRGRDDGRTARHCRLSRGRSFALGSSPVVSARDVDIIGTAPSSPGSTVTATGGQLSVLAGGRRAPNPAELLSGHSFAELVAEASRLFDRVVIDSAPVLAVSDTLLMTPHVQSVCV